MITPYDKAIGAFLSASLGLAAAFGLPIGPQLQTAILALTPVLALGVTYAVPNRPPAGQPEESK